MASFRDGWRELIHLQRMVAAIIALTRTAQR
jgi:hypothetical protein